MAYVIEANTEEVHLDRLPIAIELKDGTRCELRRIKESEVEQVQGMLNAAIEEGMTYPQQSQLDLDGFKAYYLSHDAFTLCRLSDGEVVGAFYIKPNYPGRCSHICNAGFLVKEKFRGQGAARRMAEQYLLLAKDLGYRASFFNLVFATNTASLHLWNTMGFTRTGIIPKAGLLKNGEYVDAHQFYMDLTAIKEN